MPKSGPLLVVLFVLVMGAGASVALRSADADPPSAAPPRGDSLAEPPPPVVEFGEQGWLHRTLTVEAVGETVTVEMRIVWADGVGHVRVFGGDAAGRHQEVVTDEVRSGTALTSSLAHFQRMYDELRATGGTTELHDGVTIARQVIDTPDGVATDLWRIGEGDPEW